MREIKASANCSCHPLQWSSDLTLRVIHKRRLQRDGSKGLTKRKLEVTLTPEEDEYPVLNNELILGSKFLGVDSVSIDNFLKGLTFNSAYLGCESDVT